MNNNLLKFEEDYSPKNRPLRMTDIMRVITLAIAMILALVGIYSFPIATPMRSIVAVTGKHVVTPNEKSYIQIGGKYAEKVTFQPPDLYVIEFELDSYNMEIDVDKERFDSIQAGKHVQISYKKGGFFRQYDLLSATPID